MTDLRTSAKAVLELYDADCDIDAHMEALRQALDAPVEPVAEIVRNETGQIRLVDSNGDSFDVSKHIGTKLYATPPSVDTLIAEAIEKHDEKNVLIKTVNMRTNAQPYLDALIADLMELHLTWEDYQDVKEVCDKYRGVK